MHYKHLLFGRAIAYKSVACWQSLRGCSAYMRVHSKRATPISHQLFVAAQVLQALRGHASKCRCTWACLCAQPGAHRDGNRLATNSQPQSRPPSWYGHFVVPTLLLDLYDMTSGCATLSSSDISERRCWKDYAKYCDKCWQLMLATFYMQPQTQPPIWPGLPPPVMCWRSARCEGHSLLLSQRPAAAKARLWRWTRRGCQRAADCSRRARRSRHWRSAQTDSGLQLAQRMARYVQLKALPWMLL